MFSGHSERLVCISLFFSFFVVSTNSPKCYIVCILLRLLTITRNLNAAGSARNVYNVIAGEYFSRKKSQSFLSHRPVLARTHPCNYLNHDASSSGESPDETKISLLLLSPSRIRPSKTSAVLGIFGAISAGLIASNSPIARARTSLPPLSSAMNVAEVVKNAADIFTDFRLRTFRARESDVPCNFVGVWRAD